ncbi:Bug family tripartite tricarboxylate transporter substrate binding protein [Planococcus versutus]|uniref:Tricarboxylic transport TctC n=1 Tax=Planococcus versutus TaxID=1302659 RepID=A0A1B1S310_9BACL|nr:tripartite tricarboxylate transporter substrate-binding protein [Planococcus versutus]ANU27574.1 tricarboxylic transport TctC [Planococcus versutus]
MKKRWLIGMVASAALVVAGCGSDDAADEKKDGAGSGESGAFEPTSAIEIVAPAGAGGGWDTTAREVARVFGETGIVDEKMAVVNKEGGGGAIAWAYIHEKDDSPYNLFVSSPPIMFVPLNGQSEYGHEDFTPLSNMIADYGAFAVNADSEWEDLNDLFEDMKEDPENVTIIGASSPGSMDHIQFVRIAKAAGVDPTKIKYVSDQEGGALTALLNGSVDVYSTGVAETVEQVKAGNIKVLGITAEERLEGDVLSDFPTAMEQGIDESFVNWRGFFGPPNMEPAAVEYYEAKFEELSGSDEFAEVRKKYGWNEMYMNAAEYEKFLDEEKVAIKEVLDELGLGS